MKNEPIKTKPEPEILEEDFNVGDVCSGIGCVTFAIRSLQHWKTIFFSQYDPEHNYKSGPDFPSAVLQHHYPDVPNLGDMTKIKTNKTYLDAKLNLLVGGTPCQGFSLAGLREGLDDERSNIAIEYVRILVLKKPGWFIWENVPGMLSTGKRKYEDDATDEEILSAEGSDFANILSGFTGKLIETQTFPKAGIIQGDFYSVAYRILDSQYFGVAQRRRRIFVVGHLGNNWRPPFAVLFESGSLLGDFTKGRKKGKNSSDAVESGTGSSSSTYRKVNFGQWEEDKVAAAFMQRDFKDASGLITPANQDGGIAIIQNIVAIDARNFSEGEDISGTIQAGSYGHGYSNGNINPVLYDLKQITSLRNGSNPKDGDPSNTMTAQNTPPTLVTKDIIRRLTPLEVERLFTLPDNYTNIPWRGKQTSPDSLRYMACGNGMATNVITWVCVRLDAVHQMMKTINKK